MCSFIDQVIRIGKAGIDIIHLKKIWMAREMSLTTKIRLMSSNVKDVLLYGAETWRTTKTAIRKVQPFIDSFQRRILHIHWPDTISN
ncbi:hypothetical protein BgiMline_034327 [Biomphalaria glabrata]|nr:hypothetical protein BgiMline_020501 [Biomphalaria glabrata]